MSAEARQAMTAYLEDLGYMVCDDSELEYLRDEIFGGTDDDERDPQ